jgi:choline dehydrogenase-like flavoprotein
MTGFDYDVLIIGSGFGGSVAALRAAEKGYRVGVMESGRRWKDADIPKTQWDLPGFLCPSVAQDSAPARPVVTGSLAARGAGLGQSQELRVIWAGFSPGCSRTPYSALAVTHRISRPRWSGYLSILALK